MKKVILAITLAAALSGVAFSTTGNTVKAAGNDHQWTVSNQFKSDYWKSEDVYVNGVLKRCTISLVYIRDYAECLTHPGEVNISQWYLYGESHSLSHI
ncbi:hypothetical protein [Tumebacillus lipolyticus]|uniref:Uncharacterized protein n=1 Tax=Tumebacillus lipolyticus TaxID=1280370 RepID=A0ABW4ZSR6_9BACL